MPAVLDALVARDGAVLVPFADARAAPPRGLFVVALGGLRDLLADRVWTTTRARTWPGPAPSSCGTRLPACRRSPAVQAVLADRLAARGDGAPPGRRAGGGALLRCLIGVMWVPSRTKPPSEASRIAPATTLGGVAAQLARRAAGRSPVGLNRRRRCAMFMLRC